MPDTTPTYALPYPLGSEPPDGPGQIGALASRLDTVLGAFDANVIVGGSNGVTVSAATIPDGNTWTDVEDPVQIPVAKPGLLMVVGSVTLNHVIQSGDPQARIDVAGPVADVVVNWGRLGTGQTGGIEVQASVPVLAKATITAAGTVTLQRQVRHHISSGTGHEWSSFDLYYVVVGQADA